MGFDGKCTFWYKCKQCGHVHRARSYIGGDIDDTHRRCRSMVCECGGRYRLASSELQVREDSIVANRQDEYFNSQSVEFFEALKRSEQHQLSSVRRRAEKELEKYFPNGRPD